MTNKEPFLDFLAWLDNNILLEEDGHYPKNHLSDREIHMYKTKAQMLDKLYYAYYTDKEQFNKTLKDVIKDLEESKW